MFCRIVFGTLADATMFCEPSHRKIWANAEQTKVQSRRNLMIKKILSLHLFAALVCLVACDVTSAQLSGCANGACGIGHGGGLLQKISAGGCLGCKGAGCSSCAAAPAPMFASAPAFAAPRPMGCAGHGYCGGNCGGKCGGKLLHVLNGAKGVAGLFDGGYPHSQVGGQCRTCDNIWDGYCASKERCLPHAKYPYQNYHGGNCHACKGRGCGLCRHGGCASGNCNRMTVFGGMFSPQAAGCGAAGCTQAGCSGGCSAAPGYAAGLSAPTGAALVKAAPNVTPTGTVIRGGQTFAYTAEDVEQPQEPTLAQPSDFEQASDTVEAFTGEPVLDLAPLESAVSEVSDPIPPVPPSPAIEPGMADQTRTGSFDWLERSLRLK